MMPTHKTNISEYSFGAPVYGVEYRKDEIVKDMKSRTDGPPTTHEQIAEVAKELDGRVTVRCTCDCGNVLELDAKGVVDWYDEKAVKTVSAPKPKEPEVETRASVVSTKSKSKRK